MRKLPFLLILFSAILIVPACSKDKEEPLKNKDEFSIKGAIKEIDEETFLMESRDKVHSGDIRISKKTDKAKDAVELSVGDIIIVNYDGKIAFSDPAQITGVHSIEVLEKAEEVYDDQGNKQDVEAPKEDFYKLPILSVVHGEDSRELAKNQSAFMHDVMRSNAWDLDYKDGLKGDYKIMDNMEVVAEFDSKNGILFDSKNKVSLKLDESISEMVKEVLDNKKK